MGIVIVTLISTLLLSKSVACPGRDGDDTPREEREEFTLAKCAIFAIGGVTFVRQPTINSTELCHCTG